MASISIDVSAIVREVRSLVTEIKNERTAEKEKAKAAQMLVYRSLSLHPALDRMHPPTGMLADVDWYTELRFSFTSGIFRKLGQNEHFRRMALLGDTGTRARIMMLLLWIIGHRLAEDSVAKLLSTAMGDAIRRDGNLDLEAELVSLDSVKRVLISLQKMIKTKIPLPPDRNPFQGRDYNITDEDLALPRSELWGYELPEEQQYEYNIRRSPVLLLRPLSGKIIIPETKLTMLIIQWAACNFGLGRKVYSAQDIDHEAFWNADPPLSTNQDDDGDDDHISDWSSSSSKDSFAFEAHAGVGDPPYESMWEDEPMEDWVHSRFCSVYGVHAWAHQSFVRVLLFNSFSASQTLPTSSHISKAVHVANQLSCRLPMDILQYAEQFIVARSLLVWRETYADKPWKPEFRVLPPEERGLLVIFVDALRWDEAQSWIDVEHPSVFGDVREFLMNPLRYCQDSPDILALPRLASQYTPSGINVLPELDSDICICGECPAISSQLPASLESFRHQYFSITSFRPQDCNALARTWEPMISAAEEWLEDLVSRVECQFTLFPLLQDLDRIGPTVLELANALGVLVGSHLSDQQLLRFIVMFSIITDDIPPAVPKSPGPLGLGYVVSMPWAPDREEYQVLDSEDGPSGPDRVLFVNGGWMYDAVGLDGVSLLHERENWRIVYHTTTPGKFSAICMPNFRADFVSLFPPLHSLTAMNIQSASAATSMPLQAEDVEPTFTLVLSNWQSDAFPLLSVSSLSANTPRGALAALIRVECFGRLVETTWKPDVKQGSPCEHRNLWGYSTRCSPTATSLLQLVLSPNPLNDGNRHSGDMGTALQLLHFGASENSRRQAILRELLEEQARRVEPLTKVGSPLERTRACIVRCGARDGPVDALIVLAASLKKKVYILDYRECWECAFARMQEHDRTIGVSVDTKHVTVCSECQFT